LPEAVCEVVPGRLTGARHRRFAADRRLVMAPEVVTKARFAEMVGRHPAFVTRAIADGKLKGGALVGEGRGTRIRVAEALGQLGRVLDVSQQLAQERPILPAPDLIRGRVAAGPAAGGALDVPDQVRDDDLDQGRDSKDERDGLHGLREEQLELRNRKARLEIQRAEREALEAAGALVLAADVTAALRRQVGPLVATFDEVPASVAKAVSEVHGLVYAEVLITVKAALRVQRAAWAERARALERGVSA